MTFRQWDITAFRLQYWTGQPWATVPDGTITGNSLVWRSVSFPPLTTTKICVLVDDGLVSYRRLTEIEAFSGAMTTR